MKWGVQLVLTAVDRIAKSTTTLSEFSKILSNGTNFILTEIPKLIKIQEHLWFIMPIEGSSCQYNVT